MLAGFFNSLLLQFRQAVNDTQPHLVTDLHLHHLGGQTGSHPLSILQFELDLPATLFNEMKQQQGRQSLQFVVVRMFAEIENLRHDRRSRSRYSCDLLIAETETIHNAPKEGSRLHGASR